MTINPKLKILSEKKLKKLDIKQNLGVLIQ